MRLTLTSAACFFAAFTSLAIAEDAKFTLDNQSDYQIDEFYASPANEDDWGDDILGQEVLPGGESGTVTIADGSDQCVYDLKAVEEDGTEHELTDLNICESPSVTFNK